LLEQAITIDPVAYRTVDAAAGVADYDGAEGATLRFGDGVFGAVPGDDTAFEVTYRSGGGTRGNVAAGVITRLDAAHSAAINIISVSNPLAACGGRDEEPNDQVREMAPQRFRATQYRAVRAEDYDRAAMTLPWVQRAGTRFRYTGSWLSVFTAVDPEGSELLPADRLFDLTNLLDRYRLAGYEAFGRAPRYASLDLDVTVCARPDAFRGDGNKACCYARRPAHAVQARIFHPDGFTFGLPHRSSIKRRSRECGGQVVELRYRRRVTRRLH
jgi:predicted phage baseplate assembly protein